MFTFSTSGAFDASTPDASTAATLDGSMKRSLGEQQMSDSFKGFPMSASTSAKASMGLNVITRRVGFVLMDRSPDITINLRVAAPPYIPKVCMK